MKKEVHLEQDQPIEEYLLRDKAWLATRIGLRLKFKINGIDAESVLDFNRSLGIYTLEFFGGEVNAEIALISHNVSQ